MLLLALLLAVRLDAYLSRERRRTMFIIIVLVFSLILQNILDNRLSAVGAYNALRVPVAVYGYAVRPVILALFLYIVQPGRRYRVAWALVILNAAVYLTAFFSDIAFHFTVVGHFKGGPLRQTCTVVSALLFAYLFYLTLWRFRPRERKESWIPILVTLIIAGAVVMDFTAIFDEPPISFLTIAIAISCVFYYTWLHLQFVREHEDALVTGQRVQQMLSQIKPHFLHNALTLIIDLCDTAPQKAKEATVEFSRYLRGNAATKGLVTIGAGSKDKNIKATKGDVTVKADTGANVINVTAAMAGSGGKAVGLSANVNVFNRQSEVEIEGGDGYAIKAGGNVQAEAAGNDFTVMAGLAASGSTGEGAAVSGNLPIVVGLNTVKTTLNKVAVEAGGSAAIDSHLKDRAYAIAGTIAASNAGNAMGATAMVVVKENTVKTDLGESSVTAGGAKTVKLATTGKDYSGVYVDAKVRQTLIAGAAGVAAGGAKGITANIVTVVSGNGVGTDASKAALKADSGDVTVNAQNDSKQTVFAGGLSIGKSMGIGASVIVNVARNDVKALAHDMDAAGDVNVTADNDDKSILLNVNVGASGGNTAELGVTVTSLESKANAEVASKVTSKEGSFSLKANNTSNITNVAVALAAGAKNAATPVFVYTGYTGEANAMLKAGTVNAKKGVTVAADSNKDVDQYTIGMSASGNVALSGAVSIMNLGDATNAIVAAPTITNAAKMDVTADSDYKLVGATGTIAASGKAGVAVNGMLTIVKASTLSEMGGKATLTDSEGLSVKASSKRDIIKAAVSAGVGGTGGGVSVGVMGLIAGDKMDQEAADQLTYGTANNKDKVFDAKGVINNLKKRGIDTTPMNSLASDLEGNGQTTDTGALGHKDGNSRTFDVASGYSDGTDGENT